MVARPTDPTQPIPQVVTSSRRALQHEANALTAMATSYASDPSPTSLFARESVCWKRAHHSQGAHRRRLWFNVLQLSRLILTNMLDHLGATVRVLPGLADEPVPLYAHMPLARVVCEGAVKVSFLLDPNVGYEARLLRVAALMYDSARARLTAAENLPVDTPIRPVALHEATRQRETLLTRMTRAGVSLKTDRRDKPTHVRFESSGTQIPLNLNMTEEMELRLADRPSWYRITSGVTHSADWMLADLVASAPTDRELVLHADILGIGAAALSMIDACKVTAEAYARFYGHDPEPATVASEQRAKYLDVLMQEWFSSSREAVRSDR